jgi:AcrR family transcriptional regulator
MVGMTTNEVARRPGGRSARTRAAVIRAVMELIGEGGLDAVTVPAVGERAGVHYSSIYRRWGSVQDLVFDAILETVARVVPTADSGGLRADLLIFAQDAARALETPVGHAIVQTLISLPMDDEGDGRRLYWSRRHEALRGIFERATGRGETYPDPQDVVEAILAPLYFRRFVSARPLDDEYLGSIVDGALRPTDGR